MLMSLGPVVFDLVTNIDKTGEVERSNFARHAVIGAAPVYEETGDGESTFSLSGVIHPMHFGGLGSLDKLKAARSAKVPLPLMRGDFTPLGWVIIDSLQFDASLLNHQGVGQEIRFSVNLLRVGNPGIGAASAILRLFQ